MTTKEETTSFEPDCRQASNDRRRFDRHRILQRLILVIGRRRFDGYSYDISQGGMSVILAEAVTSGTASVQIPEHRLFFEGNILCCMPLDPQGLKRYRLEFHQPIGQEVLHKLIAC